MRRLLFTVALFSTIGCTATAGELQKPYATDPQRVLVYGAAFRLIHLADGADLLLHEGRSPNELRSVDAFLASADGPEHDRHFRTSILLPRGEVAEGTSGHVYSAAMSDDHRRIALVVGWRGANDNRGHNGVVIVEKNLRYGVYMWDRKSWFDVKGMTIGEIAFGPGDVLALTSQDAEDPSKALTLFSSSGRKLATFAGEGAPAVRLSSAHYMRLARVRGNALALYDPESSIVRVIEIAPDATITERERIAVPFVARGNLIDFQADGMRRFVFVRMDAKSGTIVWYVDASGVHEERSSRSWQIGYIANGIAHGVLPPRSNAVMLESLGPTQ